MKLDLFNSRSTLLPDTGCRIYDSIEGNFIDKPPPKPKDIIKASFKSKAPRIDTKAIDTKFDKIPDRFDQDQLDRYGRSLRTQKLQSLSSPDTGAKTAIELKAEIQSAYLKDLEEKFPSLRLDYKKDRIYDVKYETIERRVSEGQVAGGVFPLQGRKDDPPLYKVGPGDYEVYDSPTVIGGTFGLQPVNRGFDEIPNPEYFPLNERKRLKRIHAQLEKRKADNKTRFHIECTKDTPKSSSSNNTMVPSGSGAVSFNAIRRFDNKFYKQEPYVKTSGLILDANYDKKFDKKIKFSFDTHDTNDVKRKELLSMFKSEGADVDVDVDHIFSISATAARSPIKYSAAFRSLAKVGMEIIPPTSGTEIGPGSFPGAWRDSIEIKEKDKVSYYMLRGRKPVIREPAPDLLDGIKPFSQVHRKGPIFDKQGISSGNLVLQTIVKDKLTKIYPQLAKEKFPPPPPSTKEVQKVLTAFPRKKKIK